MILNIGFLAPATTPERQGRSHCAWPAQSQPACLACDDTLPVRLGAVGMDHGCDEKLHLKTSVFSIRQSLFTVRSAMPYAVSCCPSKVPRSVLCRECKSDTERREPEIVQPQPKSIPARKDFAAIIGRCKVIHSEPVAQAISHVVGRHAVSLIRNLQAYLTSG